MSFIDNLKNRLNIDSSDFQSYENTQVGLKNMQARLSVYGGSDQWIRMRQDKLRSLKKALLFSYQKAIVQKYDVKKDNLTKNIISIITILQDSIQELSDSQKIFLDKIEEEYNFSVTDRSSTDYINQLQKVVDSLVDEQPLFRCLINHDKLKVDYEDKIISIPFEEAPLGQNQIIDTDFHNGTVFKWVHGNKEEWTPDTYWIVYMQYSEETAYFRAEIRKADQEIEIITIDSEGKEQSITYRGWMTGPNETTAMWNVKKGVVWNDMNYTKLLYITKDEDTLAFFQRFDRIIINGKPWQIQAYNESYSTSKTAGTDTGIIRVALKETYTSTDQFVKQSLNTSEVEQETTIISPTIEGPTAAKPYDTLTFKAKGFQQNFNWTISNPSLAKIKTISDDTFTITVDILTGKSNKQGFYINYGDSDDTKIHVIINSL